MRNKTNKTQKNKKKYKYYKKSRKHKMTKKYLKGGGDIKTSWVGVANHQQPTGFGWLYNSFFRPCTSKHS